MGDNKIKPKALFGNPKSTIIIVNEPKVLNKEPIRSEINGWVSIYEPNAEKDRFVLISITNFKYACKFYDKDKDSFIGDSLLSMYMLKDHYDRSIITE